MRKVTDDVQRWKLMGIGALADIGIGGADAIRRIGRLFLDLVPYDEGLPRRH
ncbi:DUF1515 family protein [Rhizobium gallicum]|nr:DUF1515 family protein [Rhizobium gallicum]